MAAFIPRLSAPGAKDLNWISTRKGGRNHALIINSSTGSVLPNCTGYVHGRWLEMGEDESRLCLNNAWVYWSYTQDGYKRGQEPKLGAIVVWSAPGKAGHVAIVEKITNGLPTFSNSNYSGTCFYLKTVDPHKWPVGYTFLGYIYPDQNFTDTVGTPVARDESKEQIQVLISNLNARAAASVNADRLGYMTPGIYNILGTAKAGSYTWYNVEPGVWFAYSRGWADLLPAKEVLLYDLTITGASKGDALALQKQCEHLGIPCEVAPHER